jgi:hypothetical protein
MTLSPFTFAVGLSLVLAILPTDAGADFWTDSGCVLAKPQPVFKNGRFKLNGTTGKANEFLKLSDGVTVQLEHSQCEYLSHTYTFILKEPPSDMDVAGWQYRKAMELLARLESRSDPKLTFADEKKALQAYSDLVADPKPDVEINVRAPHEQLYELISINAKVGERDTRIVVRIWSGPY